MQPNRFYTILIVPEKTARIKRWVIPAWLFQGAALALAFAILLTGVMIFNYWYVMSQISENKQLKIENRRLKQQVQVFQNKIATVESTLDRVKTFATRLRVILNVDEKGSKVPPSLVPNATLPNGSGMGVSTPTSEPGASVDPSKLEWNSETESLELKIAELTRDALHSEELLQDQYEILYDKKSFLAALPTRQPAPGYFTSGFGVRLSPYGDRVKMHEGLDIANRSGTLVRAPADGEVTFANSKAGYGLTLVLNHGYGIETWYGHLKRFLVQPGTPVKRGMKIALLGNSGRSTGPHVHYEVRVNGYPVDPLSYIFEDSHP